MTIEEQVTGGLARWLDVFEYDGTRGLVELRAIVPGTFVPARRVTFAEVHEHAEEPFESGGARDPKFLEGLVGLDGHPRGQATGYVIHTTEREVTLLVNPSLSQKAE